MHFSSWFADIFDLRFCRIYVANLLSMWLRTVNSSLHSLNEAFYWIELYRFYVVIINMFNCSCLLYHVEGTSTYIWSYFPVLMRPYCFNFHIRTIRHLEITCCMVWDNDKDIFPHKYISIKPVILIGTVIIF